MDAIEVDGQSVPVWERPAGAGAGRARTLVFLHGLFRRPADYEPFLTDLARRLGGPRVVAPFFLGNNGLRRPPTSLAACQALARGLLDALGMHPSGEYDLVGHSTGATMALALASREPRPRAVVAINPILPTEHGVPGFLARGALITLKQVMGRAGPWGAGLGLALRTGLPFLATFASDLPASTQLIQSIAAFEWQQLEPAPATPVHLLLGAGDEFFTPAPDLEPALRAGPFPTARVCRLPQENSHEWLLLRPDRAGELVAAALGAL
jgi:pimeloyl-ACP methyl ester carboxylesterase